MTTIIARSSENTHWYRAEDGAPQYTVKAKDGSDRPTTLRDARKMDLVPSVTTIMKVAAKPGLEQWKLEQMLLAAMTLPMRPDEPEKSYIARIVADSKESGKQAAEMGTRIHESIESWFDGNKNVQHKETAMHFEESIFNHFKTHPDQPWLTERSFSSPLGFGGKVDLYCAADEHAPVGIVLDAKTKDFGPDDKIDAYDEHLMQLAAYRNGLGLPHARCANVFASRTHPGLIAVKEWSEEELVKGWEMFQCLLRFWKLKHGFGFDMAKPIYADREETTAYTLNGITYLPDYRKPTRFVAPGYHEVHRPTMYTEEDLKFFGAQKEMLFLWHRPKLASDAKI